MRLSPVEAYESMMRFARDCGEWPLRLAMHVAVAQSFRPVLIHLIKLNYLPEAALDSSVESDVLSAAFCIELGADFFKFDPAVRSLLLENLQSEYAREERSRLRSVAAFLSAFLSEEEKRSNSSQDRMSKSYIEVERWNALAILDPDSAAQQLAAALNRSGLSGAVANVQIGGVVNVLAGPLLRYPQLSDYALGVQALERGETERARSFLSGIGEAQVGKVKLRSPDDTLAAWNVQNEEPRAGSMGQPKEAFERDRTAAVSVFVSYSNEDKPFARELTNFLQRSNEIRVWLDERGIGPDLGFTEETSRGLDFVLLILSPVSVHSSWVKEEWSDTFWEQTNSRIRLVGVLYRDCEIPRPLRNEKVFDLRANRQEGFQEIRNWLLAPQAAAHRQSSALPARPPIFIGREPELAELRKRLLPGKAVSIPGMPGLGKTTLALEFAHRYQSDFESVHWLQCKSQNLNSIANDLSRQLGFNFDGNLEEIVANLKRVCANKRCLLILNHVEEESPGDLIPGGNASVLVTTRYADLRFLFLCPPVSIGQFTEEQCFELFRHVLGAQEVNAHEAECRVLFARLGGLPLAVTLLAKLIKDDVHYTLEAVTKDLPGDVTSIVRDALNTLRAEPNALLAAMSACAPDGTRLSLAASLVPLNEAESLDALQQLYSRSLVEEVDSKLRRYRLHPLVRQSTDMSKFAGSHAESVNREFGTWETNLNQCHEDLPEFQAAFSWALDPANRDERLTFSVDDLAVNGFRFTRSTGRSAEAFEICTRMIAAAERQQDRRSLQAWLGNQALILKAWGRLEEALALHKKEEAICEELGNRDGLQRSYENQALILLDWARTEEALALLKKQEAICEELGNQDGLSRSYGNQAWILQAWGRLEEALALHKKEEAICEELGNRDGLQRSYGNQALVLKAWGRLEEALALLRKQEAICEELGNQDGLSRSYGNQALILQDWGRLDEAIALLKKQETICIALGNKINLAYCYWNLALLERRMGSPVTAREKLTKALTTFQQLDMSRERDAVAADLAAVKVPLP